MSPIIEKQKILRESNTRLKVIIVGAGLGGLGAAIGLLLGGHEVSILEASSAIGEVGAGIQVLPNSSRVLQEWGLRSRLEKYATQPSQVNMLGWKCNLLSSMSFQDSASKYPGTFYWDFHRADLHGCLYERAIELGATMKTNARVSDVVVAPSGLATVVLEDGREYTADLVVGADGINSKLREVMLGKEEPPTPTRDLAYRLLLSTKEMLKDPKLASLVMDPQVNYWLGPDAHAVNYVLRGGELLNMVLLVPDNMPADGASTTEGNVEEVRAVYKDWDPRIPKLLALCESVYKWRLCIREGMERWSHPSGSFTMLGDAVHATLPYLASGAGMSFEDGAVLGEIFARAKNPRSQSSKRELLVIYEACRKARAEMVVNRGNLQQWLYHLHDGEDQIERDLGMKEMRDGEALAWRDRTIADELLGYEVDKAIDKYWYQSSEAHLGEVKSKL